jgi:WD40 repeat protein
MAKAHEARMAADQAHSNAIRRAERQAHANLLARWQAQELAMNRGNKEKAAAATASPHENQLLTRQESDLTSASGSGSQLTLTEGSELSAAAAVSSAAPASESEQPQAGRVAASNTITLELFAEHTKGLRTLLVVPSPTGLLLASGSKNSELHLWDTETGKLRATLEDHTDGIQSLAVLSSGQLLSSSKDRSVRLWEVSSLPANVTSPITPTAVLEPGQTVAAMVALPDNRVGCALGHTLQVWKVALGGAGAGASPAPYELQAELLGHDAPIHCLSLLKDGRLASGCADIRIWNVSGRVCDAVLAGHTKEISGIVELPDGRLISGSRDMTVRLWNIVTGTTTSVAVLKVDSEVLSLALLLDGGRIASGHNDGSIRLWTISDMGGLCDQVIKAHKKKTRAIKGIAYNYTDVYTLIQVVL